MLQNHIEHVKETGIIWDPHQPHVPHAMRPCAMRLILTRASRAQRLAEAPIVQGKTVCLAGSANFTIASPHDMA